MIRISQIDDELSIYKNNTVILLGVGSGLKRILNLLKYNNIEFDYICDMTGKNCNKVINWKPVIHPNYLIELVQEKEKEIVVQISIDNEIPEIYEQLKSIGINTVISWAEAWHILTYVEKIKFYKKNNQLKFHSNDSRILEKINAKENACKFIIENVHIDEYIFICSIPKTGDITLSNTLGSKNISHHMAMHTPEILNEKLINNIGKKFKVIIGVRDPISQNISKLFHNISVIGRASIGITAYLDKNINFLENGGDAQILFREEYDNIFKNENGDIINNGASSNYILDFFDSFTKNITNIFKYPFNKEKGYTVIKEDNLEVFVYQLEKMNDLILDISNWIGQSEFDEWIMGNEASNKWISNSYKEAQKNLKISQEYFDASYDNYWIKHFYSDEDINKFKEKWKSHIK